MICFTKQAGAGPESISRCIEFYDEEQGRVQVFLTNHLTLAVVPVAAVYKECRQIELFFKAETVAAHQNLVGTSANALKTQIWAALIAMLLISYLQLRATHG